ncbi:MAG: DUF2304 family protein [Patescibacteria group bacterium]|nr:DUF2304 family protein [Patescibacteria group bacterium]MDD4304319.1 DUF2304 family protein [Patescibacteria group bacterium]MDD4695582.1 DUF2304 family protein [Patescibacteria group bacterium]
MIFLRIIITIFILSTLIKLFQTKKSGKISTLNFLLWSILWISVGIVFYKPELSTQFAKTLGIGRGADLMIYASIIVIFYLIFKILAKFERINADITKITRSIAISKAEDNRKDETR